MDGQTERPRNELISQHICRNEIYFLLREAVLCCIALMKTLSERTRFSCMFLCSTVFRTSPKRRDPFASWNSGQDRTSVLCIKNALPAQFPTAISSTSFSVHPFGGSFVHLFCPEPCFGVPSVWNLFPWGPSFSPEKTLPVSCPGGREGTREGGILNSGGRGWARAKVPRSACSLSPALPASCSVPCPCFLLRLVNPLRLFLDRFLQETVSSLLWGWD